MHVIIVGAGLAGLACARMLERWKVDITIIEAADGVGGRVRSDYADGYIFDRGFQVVFDTYPAVLRQLDLAALDLHAFAPGAIICLPGKQVVLTDPLRDPAWADRLAATLAGSISPLDKLRTLQLATELRLQTVDEMLAGPDETSYDFLKRRGFSDRIIDLFFRPFYGGVLFDRTLATSAKCLRFDFKMLAEGRACLPAAGMGAISAQLAAPLLERGLPHLNTRVADLLHREARVAGVRLANGQELFADAVVVATPAPEAARLSGLPMPTEERGTVTLYYSGDEPLYQGPKLLLNPLPDAFINNAQLLTNVVPAYAPPGKHLLSATVIGIPALNDDELFRQGLRDLHRMVAGNMLAQAALASYQPLRLYRIPFAQFGQPPGLHPQLPDNRSGRAGLYFAGEFTEASSLNAAMISGEKCAANIAEDLAGYGV